MSGIDIREGMIFEEVGAPHRRFMVRKAGVYKAQGHAKKPRGKWAPANIWNKRLADPGQWRLIVPAGSRSPEGTETP